MKTHRLIRTTISLIVALALAMAGVSPAGADGNVIYLTGGTEVPPSLAVCNAVGGVIDPGDGACVLEYGQFTIAPDGKHLQASRVSYWRDESPDVRLTGYNTVEANLSMNLDSGASHMWGTWNLVPDGNGWEAGTGWQGTWNAQALPNGKFFMVGHAEGTGSFEGLRVVLKREVTMLISMDR